MTPIIGTIASSYLNITGDFESIATITPNGSTNTVTFSNIPQTYQHLQLRAIQRDSYAAVANGSIARLNGDSGSNYSYHLLRASGASVTIDAAANLNGIYWDIYPSANTTTDIFNGTILDIIDYTNTNKFKTVKSFSGYDANGSGYIGLWSGNWRSNSAVTSISCVIGGSGVNWNSKCQFALYGILG